MTLTYALKRTEIVQFFLKGLGKSPKFLLTILIYSFCPGLIFLEASKGFSRSFTTGDFNTICEWMIGTFCFMVLWVFIRGKTAERTLSVSELGISTGIGLISAQVPWSKVRVISDAGEYVLIARTNGNAFFIPSRAFTGPSQKVQFIEEADRWRKAK